MPWATPTRPSIGIGILTAICNEKSVEATSLYPNMDMLEHLGREVVAQFAENRSFFGLSEHLFAVDLFGPNRLESDKFIASQSRKGVNAGVPAFSDPDKLKTIRDVVIPNFLDDLTTKILSMSPTVVGFSVVFNQVMGSLALARRLKAADPNITIIFGGASFDDEMGQEYHRAMPEIIDHVFMGEAEVPFRNFLERIRAGQATSGIPGVTDWTPNGLSLVPIERLSDMDQSPQPDYDAFFDYQDQLIEAGKQVVEIEWLPFESSRGCWWGQVNHCIFCGINKDLLAFREKSVERVIDDIVALSSRYGVSKLVATDWIVSKRDRKELFQRLAERRLDMTLFYETRADLSKAEVAMLRDAGVLEVQPGIESLSTELLRHMRKGSSRMRHVQFLRWCKEYGVTASWNLLCSFPGEKREWYLDMAMFLPKIAHLQPPAGPIAPIEMHRFSPIHRSQEAFSITEYRTRNDYIHNFPAGYLDQLKTSYFFEFSCPTLEPLESYKPIVDAAIEPWLDQSAKRVYEYYICGGFTDIIDTRHGRRRVVKLAGTSQDAFLLCDEIQTRDKLKSSLSMSQGREVTNEELESVLDDLTRRDLIFEENNYFLALPIAARPRSTEEIRRHVLGNRHAGSASSVAA